MAKKNEESKVIKHNFSKPTERDFAVIKHPRLTEKTMSLMQDQNKVTVEVRDDANKTEVKLAFERIFQVKVVDVRVLNVKPKATTRGTRYHGHIQGYKKAIVTIAEGEAIDLFRE